MKPTRGPRSALGAELAGPVFGYQPIVTNPVLKRGSSGDIVVWAQMHLRAAGRLGLPITGVYGKLTASAVRTFQSEPVPAGKRRDRPDHMARTPGDRTGPPALGGAWSQAGAGAVVSSARPAHRPLSASMPAKAYEIDPGPAP